MVFHDFLRDVETQASAAFRLLGRKIGIENLAHLRRGHSGAGVFDSKVNIKVLLHASHRNRAPLFRGGLHGINDDVLNGPANLDGVAQESARIFADGDA